MDNNNQVIEVTTRIEAKGTLDQELLNHLAKNAEAGFAEMYGLGQATPNNTPMSIAKYEGTDLDLIGVNSKLSSTIGLSIENNDISLFLAALRNLQRDIELGEDLSYLSDIVDLDSLDHHEIDSIYEKLNAGKQNEPS